MTRKPQKKKYRGPLRATTYHIFDVRTTPMRTEEDRARRRRVYAILCEYYREEHARMRRANMARKKERYEHEKRIRKAREAAA